MARIIPNVAHISEFSTGSDGSRYNGTCTEASAAVVLTSALGLSTDYQTVVDLMVDIVHALQSRGEASGNGAAKTVSIGADMALRGASIDTQWNYEADQMPQDWRGYIRANAGIRPIFMQLANAAGIVDSNGVPEDGGVQYHAIAIVGVTDAGYLVSDPNNPNIQNDLDTYPMFALEAASPCALIGLNISTQQSHLSGGATMTIPTGWTDDGNDTLTAPNGLTMSGGFRAQTLAATNWDPANVPGEPEMHFDPIRRQRMALGSWYADLNKPAGANIWYQSVDGKEGANRLAELAASNETSSHLQQQLDTMQTQLVATQTQLANEQPQVTTLQSQLADTQKQLADAKALIADSQSHIAALQQQLATAQTQSIPVTTPSPVPSTPSADRSSQQAQDALATLNSFFHYVHLYGGATQ